MTGTTVRVGSTARRPVSERTPFVQRLLGHLDAAGVPWAPCPLGIDDEGREVATWIVGEVAASGDDVDLPAMARVVRGLHDLSGPLAGGAECVLHDDLQPRNVVVRKGEPIGLIDWSRLDPAIGWRTSLVSAGPSPSRSRAELLRRLPPYGAGSPTPTGRSTGRSSSRR